jgi:hypothetical protein
MENSTNTNKKQYIKKPAILFVFEIFPITYASYIYAVLLPVLLNLKLNTLFQGLR